MTKYKPIKNHDDIRVGGRVTISTKDGRGEGLVITGTVNQGVSPGALYLGGHRLSWESVTILGAEREVDDLNLPTEPGFYTVASEVVPDRSLPHYRLFSLEPGGHWYEWKYFDGKTKLDFSDPHSYEATAVRAGYWKFTRLVKEGAERP